MITTIRFRWAAIVQLVYGLWTATSWEDRRMLFAESFFREVVCGHCSPCGLTGCLEDRGADAWSVYLVRENRQVFWAGLRQLLQYRDMGREQSGLCAGYVAAKSAHLERCVRCQTRLADDVREERRASLATQALLADLSAEERSALAQHVLSKQK